MNNIYITLYTTPGCEACRIMKNIISKYCDDTNTDLGVVDCQNTPKIKDFKDFPTTIVSKGDDDILVLVGTYPLPYIKKEIDKALRAN